MRIVLATAQNTTVLKRKIKKRVVALRIELRTISELVQILVNEIS